MRILVLDRLHPLMAPKILALRILYWPKPSLANPRILIVQAACWKISPYNKCTILRILDLEFSANKRLLMEISKEAHWIRSKKFPISTILKKQARAAPHLDMQFKKLDIQLPAQGNILIRMGKLSRSRKMRAFFNTQVELILPCLIQMTLPWCHV